MRYLLKRIRNIKDHDKEDQLPLKTFLLALPILYISHNVRRNHQWSQQLTKRDEIVKELRRNYQIFNRLSLEETCRNYERKGIYGISSQIYILTLGERVGYIDKESCERKIEEYVSKVETKSMREYGEVFQKEMEKLYLGNRSVTRYIRKKMKLLMEEKDSPWRTRDFHEIVTDK